MSATAIWMRTAFLGGSEEVADLEGLLDPSEEQLDRPASFVEGGNFLGAGV